MKGSHVSSATMILFNISKLCKYNTNIVTLIMQHLKFGSKLSSCPSKLKD